MIHVYSFSVSDGVDAEASLLLRRITAGSGAMHRLWNSVARELGLCETLRVSKRQDRHATLQFRSKFWRGVCLGVRAGRSHSSVEPAHVEFAAR